MLNAIFKWPAIISFGIFAWPVYKCLCFLFRFITYQNYTQLNTKWIYCEGLLICINKFCVSVFVSLPLALPLFLSILLLCVCLYFNKKKSIVDNVTSHFRLCFMGNTTTHIHTHLKYFHSLYFTWIFFLLSLLLCKYLILNCYFFISALVFDEQSFSCWQFLDFFFN